MSSKGRMKCCRVCGGALQGNQRRWLYGVQDRRSSPWGSTMSLGSSVSISKSQTLLAPTKTIDLLSILTHILGESVPRGSGREEFLCGKCVSVLERVFKFDTVISRVRVLSSERLQKLHQERDKMRQWVRSAYRQRHLQDFRIKSSTSEDDGEEEKEGYRDMLRENMVLSEFECWSEKWEACTYFRRTGKRCKKGTDCEVCNSLRVSDSDYESVCGVPRCLPFQPFSPLVLSRSKSQSMPLHWSRVPSISSSPASVVGSSLSLQAPSSIQSLDSLDGNDYFDWQGDQSLLLGRVLKELRSIEGKPVNPIPGSRIPLLDRKEGRCTGEAGEVLSLIVTKALNFEEGENEEYIDELDRERCDLLRDEFVPLHRESTRGRVHLAVRQLRGQLDQAMARINTLEMELRHEQKTTANSYDYGSEDWVTGCENLLLHSMGHSLHSKEQVIHECFDLIRKLCVEVGTGSEITDSIIKKLKDHFKETFTDNERALESLRSVVSEKEKRMDDEIKALKKIGKDRETDLNTLNNVLHCNQDIINKLRIELGEKEQMLRHVHKERVVWKQREQALATVVQEKEDHLHYLKEVLESCEKDVQALSDSVIGHGMKRGGAEGTLASQLREKDSLLTFWLKSKDEQSTTLCKEVIKLTTALKDYQNMVQEQQGTHSQTVSLLMEQLCETQNKLRERGKEKKEVEKALRNEKQDGEREKWRLRDSLAMRNKLIEQVLLDSEERDYLLKGLQNLLKTAEPHKHANKEK